jgi:Mn2+/Fe2+ NRAMP family transporter
MKAIVPFGLLTLMRVTSRGQKVFINKFGLVIAWVVYVFATSLNYKTFNLK